MEGPIACVLAALAITTSAGAGEGEPARPGITRYCFTEIDVDTEPGGIAVTDMNERGQVVGSDFIERQVFHWDRRRGFEILEELAQEQDFPWGYSVGFNDREWIVGTRATGTDGTILRAFVSNRGKNLRVLEPVPGDDHSFAFDINNRGQVIGTSGPLPDEVFTGSRSVVWDRPSGVRVIADFPDSVGSRPYDINEAGQVIGASYIPGRFRGYLWDRDVGLRAIDDLTGDPSSMPTAINDRGELIGERQGEWGPISFVWSERTGAMDLVGLPTGRGAARPSDINNHHEIVGWAAINSGEAFYAVIWDSRGQIHNLNELLVRDEPDDQFLQLFNGIKITDAGWILADGFDTRDGAFRYFLLMPARHFTPGSHQRVCDR